VAITSEHAWLSSWLRPPRTEKTGTVVQIRTLFLDRRAEAYHLGRRSPSRPTLSPGLALAIVFLVRPQPCLAVKGVIRLEPWQWMECCRHDLPILKARRATPADLKIPFILAVPGRRRDTRIEFGILDTKIAAAGCLRAVKLPSAEPGSTINPGEIKIACWSDGAASGLMNPLSPESSFASLTEYDTQCAAGIDHCQDA
jgi:hypothetical protein